MAAMALDNSEAVAAVERRLNLAFAGLPDGSQAPDHESVKIAERNGFGSTSQFVYGEVGDVGPVLAKLDLNPEDVFYDLGSGRGRLVLGAAGAGVCSRAVGVELDANRHAVAKQAASVVGPTPRPCELRCGDVLTEPIRDATVAFCNNAVWPATMNGVLAGALDGSHVPDLRTAFTTSPLPKKEAETAGLTLSAISVLPVNWTSAGQPLYRYSRGPRAGGVDVDPKTEAMIEAMRAQCFHPECTGGARDICLMRVAAFAQQVRGEAAAWSSATTPPATE